MDNSQQDMVDNFVNITGVDSDRAKFYLESAGWNLELAMGSFYEEDRDDGGMGGAEPHISAPPEPELAPQPISRTGAKKSSGNSKQPSRFATVSSMRQAEESESSSDEEGQAYYAGGSERSGQQVLGPSKKKKNIVEDLFKSAKDHGAEEVAEGETSQPVKRPTFRGAGYRLGDTDEAETEIVQGEAPLPTKQKVDCVLKLWKNGFSVDDGPLRDFRDPANTEFLASIKKGEVPRELIRMAKGGEVNLNMEDHQQEEYVKPKVPVRAFTGEGHTLGSPAPAVVTSASARTAGAASSQSTTPSVKVDESKPTTNIQIRLADGSRLVAKFNHTHRVSDIRSYITASRPQYAGTNFALQTTFPNKELTDDSQTLESGQLLNAVIVQRMK